MSIEYFPSQKDISDKLLNKADFQKENLIKEEDDDNSSKETKYTIEDSCKLIEELNEKIKAFRKENQQTKEKEKRIKIKDEINYEESEEEFEEEQDEIDAIDEELAD